MKRGFWPALGLATAGDGVAGTRLAWATWVGRTVVALGIVCFAIFAGSQIAEPSTRIVQTVPAGLVAYLAFRSRSISALALAVLFLPFPKATSYGNTNVAFILLMFVVWLFRVTTKRTKPVGRTGLDLPLLGLIMAYALSFYNVAGPSDLPIAWAIFLAFLTYVALAYMVINIVQTTEDVRKIINVQAVSCAIVCVLAVYELGHPGSALVGGWIDFGLTTLAAERQHGLRIGSTFLDYELFAEYCALNILIQLFMFSRATTSTRRVLVAILLALTAFCLFATVTRGAIISLVAGLVYLGWLSRRRLNFVKLVSAIGLGIGLIYLGDFVVFRYTRSDSVLKRLGETRFESGFVPDSRVGAWENAVENIAKHPIIGHGPFYDTGRGLDVNYWPHNVYLYYGYIVGLTGLVFYLWLLWEMWRASRPRAPSLGAGRYVDGATLMCRVVLFTFIVDQLKIDYLRNQRYSFFIWFLFGLIMAIHNVARNEARARAAVPKDEPAAALPGRPPMRAALPPVALRPAVPRQG